MRERKFLAALAVAGLATGCTATPPKTNQVATDPLLAREGGVLLLIDVCVQRDGLEFGGYFVIAEAAAGGQVALEALHKHLNNSDIRVRSTVAAVCAARVNTDRSLISAADSVSDKKRKAEQPLRISGTHTEDPQYVQALGVISTYAFERAAVDAKKKPDDKNEKQSEPPAAISMSDFRAAADVLKARTQASSVLFLGALGTSYSAAKTVARQFGRVVIGMGTALATAGLGTGYYLAFAPGFQFDGWVLEGALIDLQSGQLTWSNAVKAYGDPVDPQTLAKTYALDVLFQDIFFRPVADRPAAPSNE